MADKPFIFGEKSIRDNQDIINRLKQLKEDELNIPGDEELVQDANGEGAQFKSPETGATSTFYKDGTRIQSGLPMSPEVTPSEQLKQVLAKRPPTMEEKIELAAKLKRMGVPVSDQMLNTMLTNSKNGL